MKTSIQWASPFSIGLLLALAAAALLALGLLRLAAGGPIAPARRLGLLALRGLLFAVFVVILINPVRVDETPGAVERPKVFYLVDTSQSMALGQGATRWEQVVRTIRDAERDRTARTGAQVSVFRFGSRLDSVAAPFWRPSGSSPSSSVTPEHAEPPPTPTDPDTLLTGSLESLTGRFGQVPPQAVVVFSDGQAHDRERAESIARGYGRMKIPIHVVPVGDENVGGDVAIVSMVAPTQVRKYSQVAVQLFVRSHGYKGKRSELKLTAIGPDGRPGAVLARAPIVLRDGVSSYSLAFESGDQDRRVEARIDLEPGEVSTTNNAFGADLAIDHTKIRVLYLEGATDRYIAVANMGHPGARGEIRGAYAALQDALMEDPDIECTAVLPGGLRGDFTMLRRTDERGRGLPETPSELFAYDAIILSNVPREVLSDQHLVWIDEWIGRRGGGLCMAGGPNSFASGQWGDTPVGEMLPVELLPTGGDWNETPMAIEPAMGSSIHPIWHITADDAQNRALLKSLPKFFGGNRVGRIKPGAERLARVAASAPGVEPAVAIAVQPFGRGRTMAMSTAITRRWANDFVQSWGGTDARYYKKYWRNAVYWLTENSSIGRRRLLAETDKKLYRPGEPIVLRARTYDENAAPTLDYRVAVSVEPKSAGDVGSDNSPLRRPLGGARPGNSGQGPLLPWGEEFDLTRQSAERSYTASLPIADSKSLPPGTMPSQGLRIELTAYENNTQVDSTALEVQVFEDPSEQQNPLPDHDLLHRVAEQSGGKVLNNASDLSSMIDGLRSYTGPAEIKKAPAWSRWWLLTLFIALLTVEWVWRRRLGMA